MNLWFFDIREKAFVLCPLYTYVAKSNNENWKIGKKKKENIEIFFSFNRRTCKSLWVFKCKHLCPGDWPCLPHGLTHSSSGVPNQMLQITLMSSSCWGAPPPWLAAVTFSSLAVVGVVYLALTSECRVCLGFLCMCLFSGKWLSVMLFLVFVV